MAQVTGIVKVYVNGTLMRSKEGAKLSMGGKERTAQVGHSVYGYSEKVIPATVAFNVAHTSDAGVLADLNDAVNATVRFETDTGLVYNIANAFTTKPCELAGGEGDVTVEMQGDPAIEE